jgi:hypothetical protein
MLQTMTKKIERALYSRGYHVPEVRRMATYQVCFLLASVIAMAFGARGVDFAAGVLLGTINFLALGRMIQELVYVQKGAVAVQMFSFYGRLALTALAFYGLVVIRGASATWLLIGFSTVLINILLWGMSQLLGKTSKEA